MITSINKQETQLLGQLSQIKDKKCVTIRKNMPGFERYLKEAQDVQVNCRMASIYAIQPSIIWLKTRHHTQHYVKQQLVTQLMLVPWWNFGLLLSLIL